MRRQRRLSWVYSLQLPSTGLNHLLDLRIRTTRLRISIPPQRPQSLRQNRMREMVACIHPIRIHRAQILDLELDQRTSELCRVSQLLRKFVGLELVATAEDVHQQLDDCVHWCQSVREEDESDYDGELFVEAEGLVEGLVVNEYGEESENVEEMGLHSVNTTLSLRKKSCLPVKCQRVLLYVQGSSDQARVQGQQPLPVSRSSRSMYRK